MLDEILGEDRFAFFGLEETDFLNKINEVTLKTNDLMNGTTFKVENFKQSEAKSIEYSKNYFIQWYPIYHPFVANKDGFEVSDTFPKIPEDFNFDNEKDFNFSPSYRDLVKFNFDLVIQNNTDSLISTDKIILDKIKTVKSQNIINGLLDYSNFYFLLM